MYQMLPSSPKAKVFSGPSRFTVKENSKLTGNGFKTSVQPVGSADRKKSAKLAGSFQCCLALFGVFTNRLVISRLSAHVSTTAELNMHTLSKLSLAIN